MCTTYTHSFIIYSGNLYYARSHHQSNNIVFRSIHRNLWWDISLFGIACAAHIYFLSNLIIAVIIWILSSKHSQIIVNNRNNNEFLFSLITTATCLFSCPCLHIIEMIARVCLQRFEINFGWNFIYFILYRFVGGRSSPVRE